MDSTELIAESAAQRVLLFGVAGQTYGCDITTIREIIPVRRTTRLPGAPSYVCGLINLRGTIVTVLDLGLRLEHGRPARANGSIILVDFGSKLVGVTVDEVMDVQPLAEEQIEQAAAEQARGGIVRGLGHLGDRVVILLDMHTIVKQVLL